jgi:acyl-CoA thioester hydrolase
MERSLVGFFLSDQRNSTKAVRIGNIENDPAMPPFTTTRRVEFCQTDAGGIMHFAGYFEMMEQAEHELLRHLGLSVVLAHEGLTISWPRVSARCDFRKPARFEDELKIQIGVARVGTRSVTYAAEFFIDGQSIADGELVAVCCVVEPGKELQSIEIPNEIARTLSNSRVS